MIATLLPRLWLAADLPEWVLVFERLGPGSAILIFTLATLWKVVPAMIRLMTAWKRQSDTITAAVPRVEADFKQLTSTVSSGFRRLEIRLGGTGESGDDGSLSNDDEASA